MFERELRSMPLRGCEVSVSEDGAIEVMNTLVIDGHKDVAGRVRVVTHVHSDHTVNLPLSVRKRYKIVGTQVTASWLPILGYPTGELAVLDYGSTMRVGSVRLTLVKSHHIPGTAQVVVECDDGTRILYSSDFKKPGVATPIVEADVLVIDAVYGRPRYVRVFDDYIETMLVDFVKQLLTEGGVHMYGFYGKVNEVMSVLREGGVDAPFVVPQKIYLMTKRAENLGLRVSNYVLAGTKEAEEILRDGWYVYLDHAARARYPAPRGANSVVLSGWEFERPIKRLAPRTWHVAFSAHADFKGLIHYVSQVKPDKVYVVKARSNGAEEFASYLSERLGIKEVIVA